MPLWTFIDFKTPGLCKIVLAKRKYTEFNRQGWACFAN